MRMIPGGLETAEQRVPMPKWNPNILITMLATYTKSLIHCMHNSYSMIFYYVFLDSGVIVNEEITMYEIMK